MNQKSRHHPLGSTAQTERKLYDILTERHKKIHEDSQTDEITKRKWKELLLSLGVGFAPLGSRSIQDDVVYWDDPWSQCRLVIPKELAMKILTLGTMP